MTTAQDRAYSYIKEQIISSSIKPGQRVKAQDFARKLKVSRTPVREALGRLQQERLVIQDDGWGYIVRPVTFKEILDLYKIRESLEVQAALEALPHLNDLSLAELDSALAQSTQLLKDNKLDQFRAANRRFHLLIASASGNELLHRLLLMINDWILFIGALHQDSHKHRAKEVLLENMAILNALRRKDLLLTRTTVLTHIRNAREGLLRLVGGSPVSETDAGVLPKRKRKTSSGRVETA